MAKRYALNWALLWKSIIRSSLGTTAYPYSLYIRTLDLRNLAMLLDDLRFRESAMKDFFADDMATFLKASETPVKMATRKSNRTQLRLHIAPILELVGESITRHVSDAALRNKATVALEDLAGEFVIPHPEIYLSSKEPLFCSSHTLHTLAQSIAPRNRC